jgi:hypothetical protein
MPTTIGYLHDSGAVIFFFNFFFLIGQENISAATKEVRVVCSKQK